MDLTKLLEQLQEYRGPYVEGVGGNKLARPLPRALYREARRNDLVRRVREMWYIRGDGDWKLPADEESFLSRWTRRLFPPRPHDDEASRKYWERRGGVGYEQEAFSQEWVDHARAAFAEVFRAVRPDANDTILEVGCGPGRNLWILREQGMTRLFGADFSRPQLEFARKREFVVAHANAKRLPFRSGCVDFVLFAQVLIHVPPPIAPALEEACRVARKGLWLLEESHPEVGTESAPTETPHCFRHNLTEHLARIRPASRPLPLAMPHVYLYRW